MFTDKQDTAGAVPVTLLEPSWLPEQLVAAASNVFIEASTLKRLRADALRGFVRPSASIMHEVAR